jgi:hypothetical protein
VKWIQQVPNKEINNSHISLTINDLLLNSNGKPGNEVASNKSFNFSIFFNIFYFK